MTVNTRGDHGEPVVTDPPTTIADFAAHAAYSRLVGNRIVGTASNRAAFSTYYGFPPFDGLEFYETDTGNEYVFTSSWIGTKTQAGVVAFASTDLTPTTGGYAATEVVTLAAGRFTAAPQITLGVYTQAAADQHAGVANVTATSFTLYYWRANQTATSIGWAATPSDS